MLWLRLLLHLYTHVSCLCAEHIGGAGAVCTRLWSMLVLHVHDITAGRLPCSKIEPNVLHVIYVCTYICIYTFTYICLYIYVSICLSVHELLSSQAPCCSATLVHNSLEFSKCLLIICHVFVFFICEYNICMIKSILQNLDAYVAAVDGMIF